MGSDPCPHPHKCHSCGWIERMPGGTWQNDGLETGIRGATAAACARLTRCDAMAVQTAQEVHPERGGDDREVRLARGPQLRRPARAAAQELPAARRQAAGHGTRAAPLSPRPSPAVALSCDEVPLLWRMAEQSLERRQHAFQKDPERMVQTRFKCGTIFSGSFRKQFYRVLSACSAIRSIRTESISKAGKNCYTRSPWIDAAPAPPGLPSVKQEPLS